MSPDKATLQELDRDRPTVAVGEPVAVQFNPASLRIQVTNQTSGARVPTGPKEEHTGGSSTLSLDLHFDTADEGTTGAAIDVRSRTAEVARFVLPRSEGPATQPPPRVRFHWGPVIFDGVMNSMSEDLELFSSTGVPLRAKLSVSIAGQDPRYESATGRAAAKAAGATVPGAGALALGGGVGLGMSAGFGAAIGGSIGLPQLRIGGGGGGGLSLGAAAGGGVAGGFGTPSVGVALDGESPAAFAARMGLDPAAWRTLAAPGGIQLSLAAGTEVAFPQGVGRGAGVGTASGAGQPSSEAALAGVDGPASARAPRDTAATGFALARAGGVDAAVQTARRQRAAGAQARELAAFGLTGAAAPPPPVADERATSFGRGVPLRPRRAVPHGSAASRAVLGRRHPAAGPAPPRVPRHGGDCGCGCAGAS